VYRNSDREQRARAPSAGRAAARRARRTTAWRGAACRRAPRGRPATRCRHTTRCTRSCSASTARGSARRAAGSRNQVDTGRRTRRPGVPCSSRSRAPHSARRSALGRRRRIGLTSVFSFRTLSR
jgi:hypothetical protein